MNTCERCHNWWKKTIKFNPKRLNYSNTSLIKKKQIHEEGSDVL